MNTLTANQARLAAILLLMLLCGAAASMQTPVPTTIVTPTTKTSWTSEDYSTLFGTIPIVSSYVGEFYRADSVEGELPLGPPAITVDWGKPPIGADLRIESPPILPLLQPNVVYVAFVRALGFADGVLATSTRSNKSEPFVAVAQACTAGGAHAITIRVDDWTRDVPVGGRGKVSLTLANSYPITLLQVKLGAQVVGEVTGADLRDLAGLFFSVPRSAGSYSLAVAATDSMKCLEQTTAIRLVTVQ